MIYGTKQVQKLTSHLEIYAFPHLEKMVVSDIERVSVVKGLRTGDNPPRWKGNLALSFPARAKVVKVEHYKALPVAEMREFWHIRRGERCDMG